MATWPGLCRAWEGFGGRRGLLRSSAAMPRVIVLLMIESVLASCSSVESAGRTVGDLILGNTPEVATPTPPPSPPPSAPSKNPNQDCSQSTCRQPSRSDEEPPTTLTGR